MRIATKQHPPKTYPCAKLILGAMKGVKKAIKNVKIQLEHVAIPMQIARYLLGYISLTTVHTRGPHVLAKAAMNRQETPIMALPIVGSLVPSMRVNLNVPRLANTVKHVNIHAAPAIRHLRLDTTLTSQSPNMVEKIDHSQDELRDI